jgi:hypothetical protein
LTGNNAVSWIPYFLPVHQGLIFKNLLLTPFQEVDSIHECPEKSLHFFSGELALNGVTREQFLFLMDICADPCKSSGWNYFVN